MTSSKTFQQAGNYIHGHFQNHGVQLTGNSIHAGGNVTIHAPVKKDPRKECYKALHINFKDPIDDRSKILSLKPRLITATCDWIITNSRYKQWSSPRTRSQLLWVSGGQARGKTMLSIFLTKEFDRLAEQQGDITVLYYFIDRQDKRDTAVHVLRGLILRLVEVRGAMLKHLVKESKKYETESDLFGPNSIESLWRVFKSMVRDPLAGQVYCVLDGLDACTEESLRILVGIIRDFFLDETPVIVDEGPNDSSYGYGQNAAPRSARPRFKEHAGLKMLLVSREEPEWLREELKEFPSIPIGGGSSRKADYAGPYSARPVKKAPKLADIARTALRKQTLEKAKRDMQEKAGPYSAPAVLDHPVSRPYTVADLHSQHVVDQAVPTSGSMAGSIGNPSSQEQPPTYQLVDKTDDVLAQPSVAHPETQISSTCSQTVLANTAASERRSTPASISLGISHSAAITESSTVSEPPLPHNSGHDTAHSLTAASAARPIPSSSVHPRLPSSPVPDIGSSTTSSILSQPAIDSTVTTASSKVPATDPTPAETKQPTPRTSSEGQVPVQVIRDPKITDKPTQYPQEKPIITDEPEKYEDHVETQEEMVDDDDPDYNPSLRLYIEAKIEELAKERGYATEVQSFVCAALEFRGDGTFLWVDFAIEELKKITVEVMEETVNSLPPSLDDMYCRVLRNVPPNVVELVIGLLRWTVCARRPMDLLELTVALNLSHYTPNDAMAFILQAVTACGNMITVGQEDLTVNLVHNSLVELLTEETSPLLNDPYLSRFHIRPAQIDGDIATFCISYLESGPFNEHYICQTENEAGYTQHIARYPFIPYAAIYWPEHLRDAANPYLNMSSPFFLSKSKCRKNWWTTYFACMTGRGTLLSPSNFTLLHLAAYLNLVPLAQQIVNTGQLKARLNKRDSHGMSPLDYTLVHGHIPMFLFLIKHNAKQEPVGESVLELACRKNQRDMVELLLNMGWNPNLRSQPQPYGTSLYQMARYLPGMWYEGLDLNTDGWHMLFRDRGVGETPLHGAATYGHAAVMELLLDRGAVIDAGTTKGFTPLMSASYTGQMECVELLVKRGANIWAVTTDNWLAMHYAAMRAKFNIVEFFVERGVPIEALTVKSKSALHLAAYAGSVEIVEYLLGKGANIEAKSYKGETPLHLATRHNAPWMVELLLSYGADRSAVNNEGLTAIQKAQTMSSKEAKESLRILQTYGLEGYVPWQPPQPAEGAAVAPAQTPQATGQSSFSDPGMRRASTAVPLPVQPLQQPQTHMSSGFEAQAHVSVQMSMPQPVQAPNNTSPAQTGLGNSTSGSPQASSRYAYDPNANMQAFGSMSPPSAPPPPYTVAAGNSPPSTFAEKSPAWTAEMNQVSASAMEQTSSVQASPPNGQSVPMTPSTTPTANLPDNLAFAHQQPTPSPVAPSITSSTSPTSATSSTPGHGGLVGMLSSMNLSSTPAPGSAPQFCELPASPSTLRSSSQDVPLQQPQPRLIPPAQIPETPQATPAPLMSPFQPTPTPGLSLPHQAQSSASPSQPAQPHQMQQSNIYPVQHPHSFPQTPAQPTQPQYGPIVNTAPAPAPAPTPVYYTTTPTVQSDPAPQPMNPIYGPQLTHLPYAQPVQQFSQTPVQTPQMGFNSAASSHNYGQNYTYGPVNTQYNPGVGQLGIPAQQPHPGGWSVPPNHGMMFSGPPQQPAGKRKSFLGGLITKG